MSDLLDETPVEPWISEPTPGTRGAELAKRELTLGAKEGVVRKWRRKRGLEDDRKFALFVFVLSLLVHLAARWALLYFEEHKTATENEAPANLATRVVTPAQLAQMLSASREARKQVVETQKVAPPQETPKDEAPYVGEQTQRVQKQTVAKNFGNVDGGARSSNPLAKANETPEQRTKRLENLGFGPRGTGRIVLPLPPLKLKQESPSGTDPKVAKGAHDSLGRDVEVGSETILNTDEYKYASFFNRLKADVAPRWEPLIHAIIDTPKSRLARGYYRTETLFFLNSEGTVINVNIDHPSGVDAFDEAARQSLKQLLRVRNPPVALRDPDGIYRIHLGFVVNLENSGIQMDYVPDPRLPPGPGE